MDPLEDDDLSACAECGRTIRPGIDTIFEVGEDGALCLRCAETRGGTFDAETERWTTAPDVRGI